MLSFKITFHNLKSLPSFLMVISSWRLKTRRDTLKISNKKHSFIIWCTKNFCATMFFLKVSSVFYADEKSVPIMSLSYGANLNLFTSKTLFDFSYCATVVNSLYFSGEKHTPQCKVTSLVNVKLKYILL